MSRAQRIAFVSPRFPEGPTVGGAETLLRNLATRAAASGREITFLTTCARDHFTWANEIEPGDQEFDGVMVKFFPVNEDRDIDSFLRLQQAIDRGRELTDAEQKKWIANSVNSSRLSSYLEKHLVDFDRVVIGPYLYGITYATTSIAREKAVLVPCLHDEVFAYLDIIKTIFDRAGRFAFNSAPERDLALRLYDLDPDACYTVGLGMEPFNTEPGAFAEQHGIHTPYVLYSGRREPLKGTPLLLDYMAAFRQRTGRDIKLVLTGTGHFDTPAALQGHVIDVGFVSEKEKHDAMAGALAFCHPSRNESFGIVLLESWLAGTPAIVSGWGDVLVDQCRCSNAGLWFRTYPEFEEELILLADDPRLRSAMGTAGKSYVTDRYSWPSVESRFFAALDT